MNLTLFKGLHLEHSSDRVLYNVKTSELTGAALDWAVAKCEGEEVKMVSGQLETLWTDNGWKPSTDWSQGGPIIERERLQISPGLPHDEHKWSALKYDHIFDDEKDAWQGGPTPLIAAMRCYVASKLGDEVTIPF